MATTIFLFIVDLVQVLIIVLGTLMLFIERQDKKSIVNKETIHGGKLKLRLVAGTESGKSA